MECTPLAPTPQALRDALQPLQTAPRTPGYRVGRRELVATVLSLPTDNQERKARIVDSMSSAPQHVMASAFANIFSETVAVG